MRLSSTLPVQLPGAEIDRIEQDPRITVWSRTQVTALTGTGQLQGIRISRAGHPGELELAISGLFIFIGARPELAGWPASSPKTAAGSCSPVPTFPRPGPAA